MVAWGHALVLAALVLAGLRGAWAGEDHIVHDLGPGAISFPLRGGFRFPGTFSVSKENQLVDVPPVDDGSVANETCSWEEIIGGSYKLQAYLGTLYRSKLQRDGKHTAYHMMVNRKRKFAVCGIEKVGITLWTRIMCRLYHNITAPENPALGPLKQKCSKVAAVLNQQKLRGYEDNEHKLMRTFLFDQVIGNPQWYIATFLRDPLERLLSGYLDKCVNTRNRHREGHCEHAPIGQGKGLSYKGWDTAEIASAKGFEKFVDFLPNNTNLHFFPQSHYCLLGELRRELGWYNFVGNMNATYAEQVRAVQRAAGWADIYIDDLLDKPQNQNRMSEQRAAMVKEQQELMQVEKREGAAAAVAGPTAHAGRRGLKQISRFFRKSQPRSQPAAAATLSPAEPQSNTTPPVENIRRVGNTLHLGDSHPVIHPRSRAIHPRSRAWGMGGRPRPAKLENVASDWRNPGLDPMTLNPKEVYNDIDLSETLVQHYFTPRVIKKALQFYAVDYVDLRIPLPAWLAEFPLLPRGGPYVRLACV